MAHSAQTAPHAPVHQRGGGGGPSSGHGSLRAGPASVSARGDRAAGPLPVGSLLGLQWEAAASGHAEGRPSPERWHGPPRGPHVTWEVSCFGCRRSAGRPAHSSPTRGLSCQRDYLSKRLNPTTPQQIPSLPPFYIREHAEERAPRVRSTSPGVNPELCARGRLPQESGQDDPEALRPSEELQELMLADGPTDGKPMTSRPPAGEGPSPAGLG